MSHWSSGYNIDVPYTYGFYEKTAPNWLDFVATFNGMTHPVGSWRYLELGCGNGVGLIILAALHPDHDFVGIDFEPGHIAHGRTLAKAAGLRNIQFIEEDFMETARQWPQDRGSFDYVVAHGVISWMNPVVRRAIFDTINAVANPGALIYLSYNAMPGQTSLAPVQHLLRLWQTTEALPALEAISSGMKRLEDLQDAASNLTEELPLIKSHLDGMQKLRQNYLVHEYLHEVWQPLWFDEVAREADMAKLTFVGSAEIGDRFPEVVLTPKLLKILEGYENPVVREVMLDTILNRSFRTDVFARGAHAQWPGQQEALMGDISLCLGSRNIKGDIDFTILERKVSGKTDSFRPFIEMLRAGPKPILDLMTARPQSGTSFAQTQKITMYMLQSGCAKLHLPVTDKAPAKRLNRAICDLVANGAPYRHLIATETGTVFNPPLTDMIMLAETLSDPDLPTARTLAQRLVDWHHKRGKPLSRKPGDAPLPQEEMLPLALTLARAFLKDRHPAWMAAGVL